MGIKFFNLNETELKKCQAMSYFQSLPAHSLDPVRWARLLRGWVPSEAPRGTIIDMIGPARHLADNRTFSLVIVARNNRDVNLTKVVLE